MDEFVGGIVDMIGSYCKHVLLNGGDNFTLNVCKIHW